MCRIDAIEAALDDERQDRIAHTQVLNAAAAVGGGTAHARRHADARGRAARSLAICCQFT
jgi:hypothetical protein